jgi:hypothetical protein
MSVSLTGTVQTTVSLAATLDTHNTGRPIGLLLALTYTQANVALTGTVGEFSAITGKPRGLLLAITHP